ncbi:flagellar hook-length control protein FliK [Niveibacterium sp. SC-1]|uniref:flagellar hook-length control protein FliK n=1 Tax=Niveibacterium sp. SC-1 TaxID=3135646 RepID=UPI00311F3AF7
MIPADLVSRMRTLLTSTPLPVGAVTPTQPTDAGLAPGQRFTAQVIEPQSDGTFKALVGGRTLTLALPQSVNAGDILELEVSSSTPQTVYARLAEPAASASGQTQLSGTAQLISQFAANSSADNRAAAPLARGEPLLPQAPNNGTELAPQLAKAVSESGVFYEAHQARWVAGDLPLDTLLREPQAQGPGSQAAQANASAQQDASRATVQPPREGVPDLSSGTEQARGTPTQPADAPDAAAHARPGLAHTAEAALNTTAPLVPREFAPLVQQQLDALFTQQLVWHGQAWPGQQMEWQIDLPERPAPGMEPSEDWNTRLRLTLPRLGEVDARLHLTSLGLALHIDATDPATAAALQESVGGLADALAAAGVPLTGHAIVTPRDE